jgi:hypothetical protein
MFEKGKENEKTGAFGSFFSGGCSVRTDTGDDHWRSYGRYRRIRFVAWDSQLRWMDRQAVCTNCQDELDSITWDIRTNFSQHKLIRDSARDRSCLSRLRTTANSRRYECLRIPDIFLCRRWEAYPLDADLTSSSSWTALPFYAYQCSS